MIGCILRISIEIGLQKYPASGIIEIMGIKCIYKKGNIKKLTRTLVRRLRHSTLKISIR